MASSNKAEAEVDCDNEQSGSESLAGIVTETERLLGLMSLGEEVGQEWIQRAVVDRVVRRQAPRRGSGVYWTLLGSTCPSRRAVSTASLRARSFSRSSRIRSSGLPGRSKTAMDPVWPLQIGQIVLDRALM